MILQKPAFKYTCGLFGRSNNPIDVEAVKPKQVHIPKLIEVPTGRMGGFPFQGSLLERLNPVLKIATSLAGFTNIKDAVGIISP